MKEMLNTKSNFIVLHHRKASVGNNTLENLHPFEYNGKYYLHNGTAQGYQGIKKWFEINCDTKFKSETDTEVIAVVYNMLKDKYKNKPKEIFKQLTEVFPNGFGVLIEVDNENVTIIKDYDRNLWAYTFKTGDIYLISEPVPTISKFNKLLLLDDGIYSLDNISGVDYTKSCREAIGCWFHNWNVNNRKVDKCDYCGTEGKDLASTFYIENGPLKDERESRCFECIVLSEVIDEDVDKLTNKRIIYEGYIGE
jgi:hypothetical protein